MSLALTAETLRGLLRYDYDLSTGVFTRRVAVGRHGCHRAGSVAGCFNRKEGYWVIRVCGHLYAAHRLAWLYVNGGLPKEVDHILCQQSASVKEYAV